MVYQKYISGTNTILALEFGPIQKKHIYFWVISFCLFYLDRRNREAIWLPYSDDQANSSLASRACHYAIILWQWRTSFYLYRSGYDLFTTIRLLTYCSFCWPDKRSAKTRSCKSVEKRSIMRTIIWCRRWQLSLSLTVTIVPSYIKVIDSYKLR